MDRRKFIKNAAGLFTMAAPAIIRPEEAWAQFLNLKFGASGSSPPPPTTIPLSFSDPRFASNTAYTGSGFQDSGSILNKTFNENPLYPSSQPAITWSGSASGNVLSLSQCNIDWREGPRFAGTGAASTGGLTLDQCFINTVGYDGDHADGCQGFAGTPGPAVGTLSISNTCFRAYTLAEAQSLYGNDGAGDAVTDSDCVFCGDNTSGTVKIRNSLFWGGSRGITLPSDTAVVNIDWNGVYVADSPAGSGWPGWAINLEAGCCGGTFNIVQWANVYLCSVIGGVITNLRPIAQPTPPASFP
jgi:hypothetical protein